VAPVQAVLIDVMRSVGAVGKSDRNQAQNFSFRGIDAVLNAVSPALREHGVVVLPTLERYEASTVEVGRNRTSMGHVTVEVTYTFVGPDGDSLACKVPGEAMDSGDKAASKAMSVAFRTALIQALALPTDEPDPDSTSYERSDAPPLMTSSQQTAISERLAGLADEFADEVKAWWKAQRYPAMSSGRLTEEEAAVILSYLDEHTPADPS
jgi:hypothetical protein